MAVASARKTGSSEARRRHVRPACNARASADVEHRSHRSRASARARAHARMTLPVVRFTVKGHDYPADAPTSGSAGRPYTVVYDGFCKVCKRLVRMLLKWDKKGE